MISNTAVQKTRKAGITWYNLELITYEALQKCGAFLVYADRLLKRHGERSVAILYKHIADFSIGDCHVAKTLEVSRYIVAFTTI